MLHFSIPAVFMGNQLLAPKSGTQISKFKTPRKNYNNSYYESKGNTNSPRERFLAEFQLFEKMRKELTQHLVANTTTHYTRCFVCSCHYLHPTLVNTLEPLSFLKICTLSCTVKLLVRNGYQKMPFILLLTYLALC